MCVVCESEKLYDLQILRSDHDMEDYNPLIAKHLIGPASYGPDELDCSYPIVGHQDFLNNPLAIVTTDKLSWSCYLQ